MNGSSLFSTLVYMKFLFILLLSLRRKESVGCLPYQFLLVFSNWNTQIGILGAKSVAPHLHTNILECAVSYCF